MQFDPPLIPGRLIKRYKRFFVDIELEEGEHRGQVVTAHCPNTGSMLGVVEEGRRVGLSYHADPKRKLSYTLQIIEDEGVMVGVNTHIPNKLVHTALQEGFFPMFEGYTDIHKEVKVNAHSRLDFALTHLDKPTCYIEVKNVHYKKDDTAYFPDSVTERGQKHLKELMNLVEQGHRCAMVYVIQREDVSAFSLADFIDPAYAALGGQAKKKGIDMYAFTSHISFNRITLMNTVSIKF